MLPLEEVKTIVLSLEVMGANLLHPVCQVGVIISWRDAIQPSDSGMYFSYSVILSSEALA